MGCRGGREAGSSAHVCSRMLTYALTYATYAGCRGGREAGSSAHVCSRMLSRMRRVRGAVADERQVHLREENDIMRL